MNYFPKSIFLVLSVSIFLFSHPWKQLVCQHLFCTPISLVLSHENIGNKYQLSRSHRLLATQGNSSSSYHLPLLHSFFSRLLTINLMPCYYLIIEASHRFRFSFPMCCFVFPYNTYHLYWCHCPISLWLSSSNWFNCSLPDSWLSGYTVYYFFFNLQTSP